MPRKRQSIQRAIAKAAARIIIYRFVNDLIDGAINKVAKIIEKKNKRTTDKSIHI